MLNRSTATPVVTRPSSHPALWSIAGVLALLVTTPACNEGDGDQSQSGEGEGGVIYDGSMDGGPGADVDAAPDSGPEPDAGSDSGDEDADVVATDCTSDSECQDDSVCNGEERCVEGSCTPAAEPLACPAEHPCSEAYGGCDCTDPNVDRDGYNAIACGGDDCDDANPAINPKADEKCDSAGVDEDCKGWTYQNPKDPRDGDADGDGFYAIECFNIDRKTRQIYVDPDTGERAIGDDCDDHARTVHPEATETCDLHDNDCDGFVDEKFGAMENDGMWVAFYEDRDGDGFGNPEVTFRGCAEDKPVGYVSDGGDCNDDPEQGGAHIHPNADEVCDGVDNDCNLTIDADDPRLLITFDFEQTDIVCAEGTLRITQCPEDLRWCDQSTVAKGCETDATRLSSCRDCETDCKFACGLEACDEVVAIALGEQHSCARTREGRAACWGRGGSGRLGNDSFASSAIPAPVVGIADVSLIASGLAHSCAAVGANRAVYCWGSNEHGQLGNDDVLTASAAPIQVIGVDSSQLDFAVAVAAGVQHSCAALESGQVACWGEQAGGRLGDGFGGDGPSTALYVRRERNGRLRNVDDGKDVAVGYRHSCLLTTAGTVECWGDNSAGQLGAGPEVLESDRALPVPDLVDVTKIASGTHHTCALAAGQVYCWGVNSFLQLGRITDGDEYQALPVEGLSEVVDIAAGLDFSCAVTADGELYCWGSNLSGQLGADPLELEVSNTPVLVPLEDVVEVAAGAHVCARTQQQVYCWTDNAFGQSGNGRTSVDINPIPLPISPLSGSKP